MARNKVSVAVVPPGEHVISVEPWPRRVRVLLGPQVIADSVEVRLLRETDRTPVFYFPRGGLAAGALIPSGRRTRSKRLGPVQWWHVRAEGGRELEDSAWSLLEPPEAAVALRDHVAFTWDDMDAWYEEDEELVAHPRDPYHRVDCVRSSRRVRVRVDGEVVAESRRAVFVFEPGYPTRYYLPRRHVRAGVLQPSGTRTRCPYKGVASYRSLRLGERVLPDVAWVYERPHPACASLRGRVAFHQERGEVEVEVEDGS